MDNDNKKEVLLKSFFDFIIKPKYFELKKYNFLKSLKDVLYFTFFGIFISFIVGIITSQVIKFSGYDMEQHSVLELFNQAPLYVFVFLAVVWAPITEELTFRLGMRFSKWSFSFAIAFILNTIIFIFFDGFFEKFEMFLSKINMIFLYFFSIIFLVLAIRFILIFLKSEKIVKFYQNKFSWIFYGLTFLFGIVHILNFENFTQASFAVFFLFLPQLAVSFILGFIRMFYGLKWSIFSHFFYNLFFITPLIFFSFLPSSILDLSTEEMEETVANFPIEYLSDIASFFIFYLLLVFLIIVVSLTMIWNCLHKK